MVERIRYEPGRQHYVQFFSTHGMVGEHIRKLGMRVSIRAKGQAGVKTGRLRASIRSNVSATPNGPMAEVGSNRPYALLHHEGSRPHKISAKRAKVLRFKTKGRIVYAHTVNHPGTRPNRYLTDNLRRVIN